MVIRWIKSLAKPKYESDPAAVAEVIPEPPVEENPSSREFVQLSHEKIAQRAYEIWIARGRPIGTGDRDWLEAEAQLLAEYQGASAGWQPNRPR